MKKITLILSALFFSAFAQAQYSFSQFNAAYTPLSAANDHFDAYPNWDDDYVNLPIGFPVISFGKVYDSVLIESNGTLLLNNNFSTIDFSTATDTFPAFIVFGEFISMVGSGDLISRNTNASPIIYELQGVAGNRIAKIEWQNAGFYSDPSGDYSDSVNFQVWIYEIDGSVEFRYGTSQVSTGSLSGATGPTVGVGNYYLNPDFDFTNTTFLSGNPVSATTDTMYGQVNGIPPNTKVYRWANLSIGVNEQNNQTEFGIYPNPANNDFVLICNVKENIQMNILDVTGKSIYSQSFQATGLINHKVDASEFAPGIYFVSMQTANGVSAKKLVITK